MVYQTCSKTTGFCKIQQRPGIGAKKNSVSDHVLGEVQKVFDKANVKITDDTKTVNDLLWGFTDPGFVFNFMIKTYMIQNSIKKFFQILLQVFSDFDNFPWQQ